MPSSNPTVLAARPDRVLAAVRLRRQERALRAAVHEALSEYAQLVLAAVEAQDGSETVHLAASVTPDPGSSYDQSAHWPSIVDRLIVPALHKLTAEIPHGADSLPTLAVKAMNRWRSTWVASRTILFKGMAAEMTDRIRSAIATDVASNGPSPYSAVQIVRDHLSQDRVTAQATTIARTEVMAGNNQGAQSAWQATAHSLGSGATVYKTWLATEDNRTRETHAEVDGMEIGISDSFTVGGWQMNAPGDDAAGPEETINCRCTVTYRVENADGDDVETPDGDGDTDDVDSLTAAADLPAAANSGVAIMGYLSPDTAAPLAQDGGIPADDLHVTLGYLAQDADQYDDTYREQLLTSLAGVSPLPADADVFATAVFNPNSDEREPCQVLLVQGDQLAALHDAVTAIVGDQASTTFPTWIPHVALSYDTDPEDHPDPQLASGTVTIDRLVVGWGDQEYPISPQTAVTAAGDTEEPPMTAPVTDTPAAPADPAALVPAGEDLSAAPTDAPQWEGPLADLSTVSADGRVLLAEGGQIRPLPLPLSFQRESSHGGEEAGTTEICGRITSATIEGTQLMAQGDWRAGEWAQLAAEEASARVGAGLGMVSVDVAPRVVKWAVRDEQGQLIEVDPMMVAPGDEDSVVMVAVEWELMGATLVADPAFGGARINLIEGVPQPNDLDGSSEDVGEPMPIQVLGITASAGGGGDPVVTDDGILWPDGTSISIGDTVEAIVEDGQPLVEATVLSIDPEAQTVTLTVPHPDDDQETSTVTVPVSELEVTDDNGDDTEGDDTDPGDSEGEDAAGITAAGSTAPTGEHVYDAEWFEPVVLDGPTPITITADGRIYGHAANWGTCHIGFPGTCVTPPSSPSGYAYFHTGEVLTSAGPLPIGKLTVGGGHADPNVGWRAALEHYDKTGTAVAVVRAHEDEHGIQVTGALIAGAAPDKIAEFRRSPLSGDWRNIGGALDMVAACGVNVGGFPVPRVALAASGKQMSLVAAGVLHADTPAEGSEPETTGGITLPSGVKLNAVDVAVLASAFDQITQDKMRRATKAEGMRTHLRAARRRSLLERIGA
jgi:hypothetical protein